MVKSKWVESQQNCLDFFAVAPPGSPSASSHFPVWLRQTSLLLQRVEAIKGHPFHLLGSAPSLTSLLFCLNHLFLPHGHPPADCLPLYSLTFVSLTVNPFLLLSSPYFLSITAFPLLPPWHPPSCHPCPPLCLLPSFTPSLHPPLSIFHAVERPKF